MKVSFLAHTNTSFGTKNKNIRTADQIMRGSKNTFPVVSSSYIDEFFHSEKGKSTGLITKISDRIFEKIDNIRELDRKFVAPRLQLSEDDRKVMYAPILHGMTQLRSGNCHESSVAALAALAANEIYDGRIASLIVETTYRDKNSGEIELKKRDFLDHCFVITTMGTKSTDQNDQIVIDPWLSFCDSHSAAIAKYKQLFQDSEMKEILAKCNKTLKQRKKENNQEFNIDDFDISQKILFTNPQIHTENFMKEFGQYCTKKFPSLKIE